MQSAVFTGNLFSTEQSPIKVDHQAYLSEYAVKRPAKGWAELLYTSRRPLLHGQLEGQTQYDYPFLLRTVGPRFLLLAPDSDLPEHLLNKADLWRYVVRPSIDVHKLVNDVAAHPGPYSLSAVWARIDAYGQDLRTTIFYGNDLANARLFREILKELSPYRATLRDVRSNQEVVTVGSRGEIGFHYSGARSLTNLDAGLNFVSRSGHMTWSAEGDND
jgi:hypothetical protein